MKREVKIEVGRSSPSATLSHSAYASPATAPTTAPIAAPVARLAAPDDLALLAADGPVVPVALAADPDDGVALAEPDALLALDEPDALLAPDEPDMLAALVVEPVAVAFALYPAPVVSRLLCRDCSLFCTLV